MSDRPGLSLPEPNKLTSPILTLLKTAKPKPTPKGQASNEEVLRSAARLMVQKGYGATSISDIAQAVGMTKAGLYHHITGKQDLLFRILIHAMDGVERDVIEPVKQLEDPEERLREIIRLHLRRLFENGLEFVLLFPERRLSEPAQACCLTGQNYLGLICVTLSELADKETSGSRSTSLPSTSCRSLRVLPDGVRKIQDFEDHLVEQTVSLGLSAVRHVRRLI